MPPSDQLLEIQTVEDLLSIHPLPPLIVGDHLSSLVLLQLCENEGVRHVVQRSNLKPDLETKVAQFMLERPRDFILSPVSVILEEDVPNLESEKRVTEYYREIDSPHSKSELIDGLKEYAQKFKNPRSVIYDLSIVADELITNAIYNAPFVDDLNSRSGPDRNPDTATIDPNKKPVLFAGSDGVRLVFGVRDLYGMLNTASLIQRIRQCYETNLRDQISYSPGGAGIGSFMIFDSCVGMYVAVDRGRSTTICCSIPINMSANKRSSVPKNIHILTI